MIAFNMRDLWYRGSNNRAELKRVKEMLEKNQIPYTGKMVGKDKYLETLIILPF